MKKEDKMRQIVIRIGIAFLAAILAASAIHVFGDGGGGGQEQPQVEETRKAKEAKEVKEWFARTFFEKARELREFERAAQYAAALEEVRERSEWEAAVRYAAALKKWQNRENCGAISGTDYRSREERQWFLTNCVMRTDCEEIRGTPYRNAEERQWFLANCIVVSHPSPTPSVSAPSVNSAEVTAVTSSSGSGSCQSGRSLTMTATAYSSTPDQTSGDPFTTASGTRVHWGTIAVDPSVIPYGCRVSISAFPGTVFVAEDTGGGIGGNRIDIWFPTRAEALNFGVQTVIVTIQ